MDCSICGNPSGADALCGSHKRILSTCSDLTPEQIRSRRTDAPRVGLVDMFGVIHPLAGRVQIGRDPEVCELAILHASVSSSHARLTTADDGITIADQASLNGTFVDGERISTRRFEPNDTLLRFGAVSFIVCADALDHLGAPPMGRRTVPRGGRGSRAGFAVHGTHWALSIAGDGARLAGGGREIGLSLMEGRLLAVLLGRSEEQEFVPSAELVSELGFGARAADGENVRELVRRLRRKLDGFGLGDVIESRRHAGYRIAPHATRG